MTSQQKLSESFVGEEDVIVSQPNPRSDRGHAIDMNDRDPTRMNDHVKVTDN